LLGNLTGTGYGLLVATSENDCYLVSRGSARFRSPAGVGAELAIMTLALGIATALARAPM
jgi:hypothetical protein